MVVRWNFSGSWGSGQFPINPKEGALPQREKNVTITSQATSPYANPIIFEGRHNPSMFPFSGTILTQSHYNFMVSWFESPQTCLVTDELGNSFELYLTLFKPTRKNRHNHPWAMDYQAEAVIVG